MVAVMIALPAVQVVLREVLELPFIGAEELTRFMLICVVFVTFPYVVASGTNIRLEEGLHLLPDAASARHPRRDRRHRRGHARDRRGRHCGRDAAQSPERHARRSASPTGCSSRQVSSASSSPRVEFALQLWKALAGKPPYVTFADEASPDDMDALEAALVAEADRGAGEAPR